MDEWNMARLLGAIRSDANRGRRRRITMGTISSAFHLISGALNADQSALAIVANNVANANTPGYSEQTPTWRENDPVSINNVNYGNGVSQTGPTSVRDRVLLERL